METMTRPEPKRKASRKPPVRTARVLAPYTPADEKYLADVGVIRLTVGSKVVDYNHAVLPVDPRAGRFAVWLSKGPSHEGYDLLVAHDGGATCDCPGHLRWRRCKHSAAVVALLAAGRLTPPAPATS